VAGAAPRFVFVMPDDAARTLESSNTAAPPRAIFPRVRPAARAAAQCGDVAMAGAQGGEPADRRRVTRDLSLFFALAYAITFGIGAAFIFFRPQVEAVIGHIDNLLTSWPYFLAVGAPTIAAVLVSGLSGGWRGIGRLFAGVVRPFQLRWLLVALLAVPAALALIGLAERAAGVASPAIDLHALVMAPVMLVTTPVLPLDPGPWGEETGWRGFALPRLLQRLTPLAAAVFLGAVWSLWHTPAFLVSGTSQFGLNFAWFLMGGVCLTVLMTWIYVNANGNYVVAGVIPHAVNNSMFTAHVYSSVRIEGLIYLAIALIIVAVFGPSLKGWRRRARPATA
jgi:membrane protease YdiL (CAAX protease family)